MTAAVTSTAGPGGGDIGALINARGNPVFFGVSTYGSHKVVFTGIRDHAGETIEMPLSLPGDGIQELRLKAADGTLLQDVVFNTLVFLVPSKGSADTALDTMMDHVQSESLPFSQPYREAFVGWGRHLHRKRVCGQHFWRGGQ